VRYSIDGNKVCCTYENFRNLAVDPAGFGDSLKEAFLDLIRQRELRKNNVLQSWESAWYEEQSQ